MEINLIKRKIDCYNAKDYGIRKTYVFIPLLSVLISKNSSLKGLFRKNERGYRIKPENLRR